MSHGGNIFSKFPDNSSEEFASSMLKSQSKHVVEPRIQLPPDMVDYRAKLGLPMVLPKRTPKKPTFDSNAKSSFASRDVVSPNSATVVDSMLLPRGAVSPHKSSQGLDSLNGSMLKKPIRSIIRRGEYFSPLEYIPQGPKVKETLSPDQQQMHKRER